MLNLPVFLLHGVLNNPGHLFQQNFDYMNSECLFSSLSFLKKFMDFVPLSEAIDLAKKGKSLRGKCVLTFDDAYQCIKKNAYDVLESLKIPATIFVIQNVIDDKEIFWRDQIRYLKANGYEKKFKEYFFQDDKYTYIQPQLPENIYLWSKKNPSLISSYDISSKIINFCKDNNLSLTPHDQDGLDKIFFTSDDMKRAPQFIEFGNHTFSHPVLPSLTFYQQYLEIKRCEEFLHPFDRALSGVLALPFGMYNQDTLNAAQKAGINIILYHSNKLKSQNLSAKRGIIDRINLPRTKKEFLSKVIKEYFLDQK